MAGCNFDADAGAVPTRLQELQPYLDASTFESVQRQIVAAKQLELRRYVQDRLTTLPKAEAAIRACIDGGPWRDAEWVACEYLSLEEQCRWSQFEEPELYAKALEQLRESDAGDAEDLQWVASKYLQKIKLLQAALLGDGGGRQEDPAAAGKPGGEPGGDDGADSVSGAAAEGGSPSKRTRQV